MRVSPLRLGVAMGGIIALSHLGWSVLVALGAAQPLLDFILRIHFIQAAITIAPFSLGAAGTLVAITFAYGFVLGAAFGLAWNWLCGRAPSPVGGRSSVAQH